MFNLEAVRKSNWLSAGAIIISALLSLGLGAVLPILGGTFWFENATIGWVSVLGLIMLWPLLYLIKQHYDLFVFLAFCTFGFVQIEPAPVDLLLIPLIGVGLFTGRLQLKRLNNSVPVHTMIWIFVMVSIFSFYMLSVPTLGGLRYTLITIYMIVIFFFVKMYVSSEKEMRIVWMGYLVSAVVNVLLVYSGFLELTPEGLFVDQSRGTGYFKDANVYGPFLLPVIIFLIDELWRPTFIKRFPLLKIGMVLILISGLFLSFSRAALGSLVVAIGIYFVLQYRHLSARVIRNLFISAVSGIVGLVVLIISLDLVDFLLWRANAVQSYDSERFRAQYDGIRVGLSNTFGIGPAQLDTQYFAPHSLYIRTFGEHGFLGFISLFSMIAFLLIIVFYFSIQSDKKVFGVSGNVLLSIAIAVLLNSFLVDTLHWRHFWFVLGLLWVFVGQYFLQQEKFLGREIDYYFARYDS